MFCEYCDVPLSDGYECRAIAGQEHEAFIRNYEDSPLVHDGWRQQDIIDMYRREK